MVKKVGFYITFSIYFQSVIADDVYLLLIVLYLNEIVTHIVCKIDTMFYKIL